jgi:hypothetical protein
VLGQGGGGTTADGTDNGGGGGGGLFGGGAGGDTDCSLSGCGAQGGGGGGSNLVPQGGSADLASGDPSVAISYQRGLGSGPPTNNKQACQKGGWKELDFKNQGACIKAMNAEN